MQGKVEICGVNTAHLKTLKNDEMVELLRRSQAGDQAARERLIEGNLRLVLSVIQRFLGRGENPDDLFQVGCVGLLKAIANFDVNLNVRFSTYGVPMIAGEIRRYLRDNSAIRVSRSMRDTAYRVLQCREAMQAEQSREPTLEEVARRLELPLETVNTAMDAISAPVSLYDPVYTDGGDPLTVMDQVRDTKNTDEQWVERISAARGHLHARASGRSAFWPCAFSTAGPRWRSPPRSASRRRRSPGWRRMPSVHFGKRSASGYPAYSSSAAA